MRQILVKENAILSTLSGDGIKFLAGKFRGFEDGLTTNVRIFRCAFKLDILSGGSIKLKFEMPQELAACGAILHGAYWEDGEVTAMISIAGLQVGTLPVSLKESDVLLVGSIYQTARFRQVKEVLPEKKRKKRR